MYSLIKRSITIVLLISVVGISAQAQVMTKQQKKEQKRIEKINNKRQKTQNKMTNTYNNAQQTYAGGQNSLAPIQYNLTGYINHQTMNKRDKASCSFSRIPRDYNEFNRLFSILAVEPQGAVAMLLIAMEMYKNNREVGEQCLRLCNTSNNVNSITSRLKELFRANDSYARPYQIAAFLRGSSPANGYNPQKPYTVDVEVADNRPYDFSQDYQSNMIYLRLKSNGHDSGSQTIYVIKPAGSQYFLINNCPGVYSQVKPISYGQVFRGL